MLGDEIHPDKRYQKPKRFISNEDPLRKAEPIPKMSCKSP